MKGISRRARACAVVAVTGVAVLASAGAASAQRAWNGRRRCADRPDRRPDVQLRRLHLTTAATRAPRTRSRTSSAACSTRDHRPSAGSDRLEALFAFLQRKGVTNIELFGHSGFPAQTPTSPGLRRTARCWTSTACTPAAGTAP